jgi:hypothetical protein
MTSVGKKTHDGFHIFEISNSIRLYSDIYSLFPEDERCIIFKCKSFPYLVKLMIYDTYGLIVSVMRHDDIVLRTIDAPKEQIVDLDNIISIQNRDEIIQICFLHHADSYVLDVDRDKMANEFSGHFIVKINESSTEQTEKFKNEYYLKHTEKHKKRGHDDAVDLYVAEDNKRHREEYDSSNDDDDDEDSERRREEYDDEDDEDDDEDNKRYCGEQETSNEDDDIERVVVEALLMLNDIMS